MEEQQLRFRTLTDAALEGIVVDEQGIISNVNPAFESMFGVRRADIIGRDLSDYVVPASLETVRQRVLTEDDAPYDIEMLRSTGDAFPVIVHGKALTVHGRRIRIVALRDVSWRRTLEHENARLEYENFRLRLEYRREDALGGIIGTSLVMQSLFDMITQATAADANVIIHGETGVGKN